MSISQGWVQGARQTHRGRQDTGDRRGHWYARVYECAILLDSHVLDTMSAGSSEGQGISSAAGA